jgi:ESS family glutamate:Na+ symporter
MGTSGFFASGGLVDIINTPLSHAVVTFCSLCLIVLIANTIRRKVKFMRRSLMPTAVIAGLLGLFVKEVILAITGHNIFHVGALGTLIYHALPVGFIALCLREKDKKTAEAGATEGAEAGAGGKPKIRRVSPAKSGSLIVSNYLFYALIGVFVTIILSWLFMPELDAGSGVMLSLGFGQGPQQASATGGIWQGILDGGVWGGPWNTLHWGEGSAQNFGITIAAFGFLWATIPGVIMINRIAKRKGIKLYENEHQTSGSTSSVLVEGSDEIPLSESIDKFSIQVCIIGAVYLLTIGIIVLLEVILRSTNVDFLVDLVATIWGFAFMIAVFVALGVKAVLKKLRKVGVMKRRYTNNYMMNRVGGVAFDMSITAALCMIALTELGMLWIPILIMTAIGGIGCIFYTRFMTKRIYKDYQDEAFIAMYGMATGTIADGMILLRELDKDFSTPASDDLVMGSAAAIGFGLPLLFIISQALNPGALFVIVPIMLAYFSVLVMFQLGLFGRLFGRFFKRPALADGVTASEDGAVLNDGADSETADSE